MLDICACLITLLQDHAELAPLILELGFVSKLRDNLEASHVTPAVYELSLLVLCAILRGSSILHRTMVLRVSSGASGSGSGSSGGGGSWTCAHNHAHSSAANTTSVMSFSASEAPMSVFSFDSTATQGEGEGEGALTMPTTYQPGLF